MDVRSRKRLLAALAVNRGGCNRRCRRVPPATCRCTAAFRHGPADRDPHRPRDYRAPCVHSCSRRPRGPQRRPAGRARQSRAGRLSRRSKAAAISARAERDRVYSGVRAEEVAILADSMRTAEANLLLAEQQNARAVALAAKDFASRQQLDESKPRSPRRRPISTSSAPSMRLRAPARSPRSAPWPMPGSRWPKRRWPTCRPSSTRPVCGAGRRHGRHPGRRTGRGRSGRQARPHDRRECSPVVRLHAARGRS